jgi:hypothetical protein
MTKHYSKTIPAIGIILRPLGLSHFDEAFATHQPAVDLRPSWHEPCQQGAVGRISAA